MSVNLYKDYRSLPKNRHTELILEITANVRDINASNEGIVIYQTAFDEPHELFTHDRFDLLYVLEGDAEAEVCGKRIHIQKHNALFVAPGVPYRVSAKENCILPVISIEKGTLFAHFHRISLLNNVISGFFADAMWGELASDYLLFTPLFGTNTDQLVDMLISEEIANTHDSQFIKNQLLICILGYLSANTSYELSKNKMTRSEQIFKILTYIQDSYRTVTLEKLAEHFHYTVPYVSKLIRTTTGLTFTEILREIKFDVCRSLLLNSDLKINKIAEVAGFQNTDHFNRVFKKHMGITPTEFKKKKSIDK